jgi:hypothetical protein
MTSSVLIPIEPVEPSTTTRRGDDEGDAEAVPTVEVDASNPNPAERIEEGKG